MKNPYRNTCPVCDEQLYKATPDDFLISHVIYKDKWEEQKWHIDCFIRMVTERPNQLADIYLDTMDITSIE